jgi:hypothetical protein
MPRITGGRLGPRACGCFLVAAQLESSANLPLPDYGRVARNPVRIKVFDARWALELVGC